MDYSYLLHTKTADRWKRVGAKRRAGIAVPLFSVYSESSIGIGEIPDIKLLVDWCNKTGMSIIQLLPLNDVGSDFAPYNSVSTFALDPMYLSLQLLKEVNVKDYENNLMDIKKRYRPLFGRVNYKIKKAKLDLLSRIYQENSSDNINDLNLYIQNNEYWLKDYALYKILSVSLPDGKSVV